MALRLHKSDPYSNGRLIKLASGETILTRELREYIPSTADRIHSVLQEDTWDSISMQYYSDSKYYHYILDVNKVYNPFSAPPIGDDIIIPDLANY